MALIDQPMIFVIGAPRSGTTWLQTLLAAHPSIVTGQETHLFSHYLLPLLNAWKEGLQWMKPEERYSGLGSYLTQEEFDELLRHFIRKVFSKLEGKKPGAEYILEKTPLHALHVSEISRYLPTARYIHIIRDGRDVAVSLMAASRTWGRSWAPSSVKHAAAEWKIHVRAARESSPGGRYVEIRYEDLLSRGPMELQRLFSFLRIPCSRMLAEQIYESKNFERMARSGKESEAIVREGEVARKMDDTLTEPEGFYRKGVSGDWRNVFSWLDSQMFNREAGELLVELGYETSGSALESSLPGSILSLYEFVQHLLGGLSRKISLPALRAEKHKG